MLDSKKRREFAADLKRQAESIRLCVFIERCYNAGIISYRQRRALDGVRPDYKPERILHILTRKK